VAIAIGYCYAIAACEAGSNWIVGGLDAGKDSEGRGRSTPALATLERGKATNARRTLERVQQV
jgi:hypothetical protein